MKVYALDLKENYQRLLLENESYWGDFAEQFMEKRIDKWSPLNVVVQNDELPQNDYPALLESIPTFSQNAVKFLKRVLENNGQLFAMICESETYYCYNVLNILDVLNEEKSKIIKFSDGKIMYIEKCVLKSIDYSDHFIFKLHSVRASTVFVNRTFVDIINKNKLKGFKFNEITIEN